jgi:hypothetical protein
MTSLKTFCETLAPHVGTTPAALYERQRALVRMGDLPAPAKGRGKGLEANPATVAMLLVAVLATDNLSDTDDRVRKLAMGPCVIRGKVARCPLTGALTFKDALSFCLSGSAPAAKDSTYTFVRVSRTEPAASIEYQWPHRAVLRSEFGTQDRRRDNRLRVYAELPNRVLQQIRLALLYETGIGVS